MTGRMGHKGWWGRVPRASRQNTKGRDKTPTCGELGWKRVEHSFPDEMAPQYSRVFIGSSFDRLWWKRELQVDMLIFAPFEFLMACKVFTSVSIQATLEHHSVGTEFEWEPELKDNKVSTITLPLTSRPLSAGPCVLTCLWCKKWHTGNKANLSTSTV